jgi:hypothetical protein
MARRLQSCWPFRVFLGFLPPMPLSVFRLALSAKKIRQSIGFSARFHWETVHLDKPRPRNHSLFRASLWLIKRFAVRKDQWHSPGWRRPRLCLEAWSTAALGCVLKFVDIFLACHPDRSAFWVWCSNFLVFWITHRIDINPGINPCSTGNSCSAQERWDGSPAQLDCAMFVCSIVAYVADSFSAGCWFQDG